MLKTNTNKKKEKEKFRYIFPAKMAAAMKKVDTRAQLEASLLSMSFLMIGLFLYTVYLILYGQQTLWMKLMLGFNMLCGFILLGSYLVTSYQQWVGHLEMMGIDPDKEKQEIKKSGNIFKRIIMARKKAKFNKKQDKLAEEIKEQEEEIKELKEKELLNNMNDSKEILKQQGNVEFKFSNLKKKEEPIIMRKRLIPKKQKIQETEDLTKLYEEQKKVLEEN